MSERAGTRRRPDRRLAAQTTSTRCCRAQAGRGGRARRRHRRDAGRRRRVNSRRRVNHGPMTSPRPTWKPHEVHGQADHRRAQRPPRQRLRLPAAAGRAAHGRCPRPVRPGPVRPGPGRHGRRPRPRLREHPRRRRALRRRRERRRRGESWASRVVTEVSGDGGCCSGGPCRRCSRVISRPRALPADRRKLLTTGDSIACVITRAPRSARGCASGGAGSGAGSRRGRRRGGSGRRRQLGREPLVGRLAVEPLPVLGLQRRARPTAAASASAGRAGHQRLRRAQPGPGDRGRRAASRRAP